MLGGCLVIRAHCWSVLSCVVWKVSGCVTVEWGQLERYSTGLLEGR